MANPPATARTTARKAPVKASTTRLRGPKTAKAPAKSSIKADAHAQKAMARISERLEARLEARITKDLHALLKRAAEVEGRSVSDFVVATVQAAAQRTVERADMIRLTLADQERFAEAILSPPAPTAALKRAFTRRDTLLRVE